MGRQYSPYVAIRVCAVLKGMVFRPICSRKECTFDRIVWQKVQFSQKNPWTKIYFLICSEIFVVDRHYADFRITDKQNTALLQPWYFIGLFIFRRILSYMRQGIDF